MSIDLGQGHASTVTQSKRALPDATTGQGHASTGAQSERALAGDDSGQGQACIGPQSNRALAGPLLFDPLLALLSDILDDLEETRLATDSRVRELTMLKTAADGSLRGLGLDARSPDVANVMALAEEVRAAEHRAEMNLRRHFRKTPFAAWAHRNLGVGERQAARLIASVGDPYWNHLHDRPRTVSELWAYCGYAVIGGEAPRRRRGVQANWNATARRRAYLLSVSCIRHVGGGYRLVYDEARTKYADAVHAQPCHRCAPAGHPAPEGSPLAPGHQHARAVRAVAKAVLRDLWLEARTIHQEADQ